MMAASTNTLPNSKGMVTFVGIAARFATSGMVIAAMANGQKIKLLPVKSIVATVIMVNTQPCPAMETAVHPNRCSSCRSAQPINFFQGDIFIAGAL